MTADKTAIIAWLSDLSATIITDEDDAADFAARLETAASLDAPAFSAEVIDLMKIVGESVDQAADFDAIRTAPTATDATLSVMTVLTGFGVCVAGCRVDWPSRPEARRARRRMASAGDAALAEASAMGAAGAELYGWLSSVTSVAVRFVSQVAATATPMVAVETGLSLPSTVLSYQLYGDAKRAGAMLDQAGASTPMLMPTRFEALAK